MSVYGQTSCTLSTITDVKAIYTYHCLISGTYAPGMAPTDNISPLDSNNQVKSTITITYNSNTYTWTLAEPGLDITNIDLNKLYYIDCTIFSNNTYDWGPALVSSSYEASKQAYNKADVATGLVGDMNQHFWSLTSPYSSSVPAGQYVTDDSQTSFKENPSGKSNLLLQSAGISLRYGAVTKAQVTSNGLTVIEGGIEGGSATSGNGYVYFSTKDKGGIAINGHTPETNDPKWRAIIGSNFGVDSAGNLYATGAHISGAITVSDTTNSNIYTTSKTDELLGYKASTNAEYSVEIKADFSNVYNTQNSTVVLTATAYKLGVATTGSFVWYKNIIGTAHGGQVSSSGTGNSNNVLTVSSSNFNNVYIAVLQ